MLIKKHSKELNYLLCNLSALVENVITMFGILVFGNYTGEIRQQKHYETLSELDNGCLYKKK